MYASYGSLRNSKSRREGFSSSDIGPTTNQLIQLVNSLNLSNNVIPTIGNNPQSFANQAVLFENGTQIDVDGNVIIGPTPTLPSHAVNLGYMKNYIANYMYPGANIMNSLLGDTVTTMVLDMNQYATNTYVQNAIADAAFPIKNTSSIYGNGWRYVNDAAANPGVVNPTTSTSNKINWYIFSNQTNNASYAYSRFNCAFIRLQFASATSFASGNIPYLAVYTLPQASGNGASWYRSKKAYTVAGTTPLVNTDVVLYVGTDPRMCGFANMNAAQFVQLTYSNNAQTFTGPTGATDIQANEVISLMGWSTNSISPTGQLDFTVVEMGYNIGTALNRMITFF